MGMYDDIKFKTKCPNCGNIVENFQSKSGPCAMFVLDFTDVDNFYASCPTCNTWIEYTLRQSARKGFKIKDYKRVVTIRKKRKVKGGKNE